jgi:hypothetical protein
MSENTKKSSAATILVAWVIVGVPLAWGVYNTVLNSKKLFAAPAAASVPAIVPASPASPASGNPAK